LSVSTPDGREASVPSNIPEYHETGKLAVDNRGRVEYLETVQNDPIVERIADWIETRNRKGFTMEKLKVKIEFVNGHVTMYETAFSLTYYARMYRQNDLVYSIEIWNADGDRVWDAATPGRRIAAEIAARKTNNGLRAGRWHNA
jgi:hypothetical protein